MKRAAILVLSFLACLVPSRGAGPAGDPLTELRGLFDAGKCDELLARARAAGDALASNPDVLVLEANCLVRAARTPQRVFDGKRYERMKIARGAGFVPPALTERFYVTRVRWDAAKRDEALTLFRRALEIAPDRGDLVAGNVAALLDAGRTDDALELLRAHRRALRERDLDDLLQASQDMLRRGESDTALRLARALQEAAPTGEQGYMAEAVVLLDRYDTRGAIRALEEAHQRNPGRDGIVERLGFLLGMARDWREESRVLATSVRDDRPHWLAWLAIARGRLAPGSDRPLWEDLRKALSKLREPPASLAELAKHRLALLAEKREPRPTTRVNAARWFLERGLPVAAVAELDAAMAANPSPVSAREEYVSLLRRRGLLDLAAQACRDGIEDIAAGRVVLGDGTPAGKDRQGLFASALARVLFGMGRDREAVSAEEQAARFGHPDPLVRGLALEALGKREEAVAAFREAAAAGGDDADWAKARLRRLVPAEDGKTGQSPGVTSPPAPGRDRRP